MLKISERPIDISNCFQQPKEAEPPRIQFTELSVIIVKMVTDHSNVFLRNTDS